MVLKISVLSSFGITCCTQSSAIYSIKQNYGKISSETCNEGNLPVKELVNFPQKAFLLHIHIAEM
jgi:hypothetical protein